MSNFKKLVNASAVRNKDPILEILKLHIQPNTKLLEISSGVGLHSAYFAEHFPTVTFQPTEFDKNLFNSILGYVEDCPTKNMLDPVFVDISVPFTEWGECGIFPGENGKRSFQNCANYFDYMLNINMMHISPFKCSEGLFNNAGKLLKPGGILFTYGPYKIDGVLSPESNVKFNASLQAEDPSWGIRDLTDLTTISRQNSIHLKEVNDRPANNKCLVWQKM